MTDDETRSSNAETARRMADAAERFAAELREIARSAPRPDWEPRWWNVSETADALGISRNTLKRLAYTDLPFWRVGSRGDRRYSPDDVQRYVDAHRGS